jgi:hypothetical protein
MKARLNLDYHEGSIERLTITVETPSRFDIDEILTSLEVAGATFCGPINTPLVQQQQQQNGHAAA